MKKPLIFGIVVMFVGICSQGNTASIGNPLNIGKGKLSIGLENQFLFDKDIESTAAIKDSHQINTKVTYGLLENLDAYVKLGAMNAEGIVNWLGLGHQTQLEYDYSFAWGIGTKGTYKILNDWLIGLDVQYFSAKDLELDEVKGNGITGTNVTGGDAEYEQTQIAFYIAKELKLAEKDFSFVPYVGGVYDNSEAKLEDLSYKIATTTYSIIGGFGDNDDEFGIFAGIESKYKDYWSLNIEGHFINEAAIIAEVTYKF